MTSRAPLALAAAVVILSCSAALGQECLHGDDEHSQEADRRQLALDAVRVINTAQSWHVAQSGQYVAFAELASSPAMLRFEDAKNRMGDAFRQMSMPPNPNLIPGFSLQFLTDGRSYLLSLKDETDPCRFVCVSNSQFSR